MVPRFGQIYTYGNVSDIRLHGYGQVGNSSIYNAWFFALCIIWLYTLETVTK